MADNTKANMSDQLEQAEDQAWEAMLAEALGKAQPPDLTESILAQLHTTPADWPTALVPPSAAHSPRRRAKRLRPAALVAAGMAALAASAVGLISLHLN